jgi:hypothetical protein
LSQCKAAGDATCIRWGCAGAAPAVAGSAPAVVISAPSEYERRAVAWLYYHNEAPDLADWRDCLARFGLERAPVHVLAGPYRAVEVRIDVVEGLYSATEVTNVSIARDAPAELQRITLGALAARRLLAVPKSRRAPTEFAPAQVPSEGSKLIGETSPHYVQI